MNDFTVPFVQDNGLTLDEAFKKTSPKPSKQGLPLTQCIDERHILMIAVLICGFFSGGSLFLMLSFLEVEPAYLCSHSPDFTDTFTCAPHTKKNVTLENFCTATGIHYQVDYSQEISLHNWFV